MYHLKIESQDYSKYSLLPIDGNKDDIIPFQSSERIIGIFHNQLIEVSGDNWNILSII